MTKCFKKVKFGMPFLNPDYELDKIQNACRVFPIHKIFQLSVDAINPELVKWFRDRDVEIKSFIFLTPPKTKSLIHIDGLNFHDFWALNFAWGSESHSMDWWRPYSKNLPEAGKTQATTTYRSWKELEVTKIESTMIETPTICNIGIPHSVENFSTDIRWSVSIRPKTFTRWATAMNLFSKEILEYEK